MVQHSSARLAEHHESAWWKLYEQAVFELDDERLQVRIQQAFTAMQERVTELQAQSGDGREITALLDARHALIALTQIADRKSARKTVLPRKTA